MAMRSMPPAVAAIVAVRDEVEARAGAKARARLEQSRESLARTRVHIALAAAEATYKKRDGPLPDSVGGCAALLLLLSAIVPAESLRANLPRASSFFLDEDEILAEGSGGLADDVIASRGELMQMHISMCCTDLRCSPSSSETTPARPGAAGPGPARRTTAWATACGTAAAAAAAAAAAVAAVAVAVSVDIIHL